MRMTSDSDQNKLCCYLLVQFCCMSVPCALLEDLRCSGGVQIRFANLDALIVGVASDKPFQFAVPNLVEILW